LAYLKYVSFTERKTLSLHLLKRNSANAIKYEINKSPLFCKCVIKSQLVKIQKLGTLYEKNDQMFTITGLFIMKKIVFVKNNIF
jgi:hypothetical protein